MRTNTEKNAPEIPFTVTAGRGAAVSIYSDSCKANIDLFQSHMQLTNSCLEIDGIRWSFKKYSFNAECQHHRFDFEFTDRYKITFKMTVIGETFKRNNAFLWGCYSNQPTWTWENSCKMIAKIRSILFKETEIRIQTLALTSTEKDQKAVDEKIFSETLSPTDRLIAERLSQRENKMICAFLEEGYAVQYEMRDISFREHSQHGSSSFTADSMKRLGQSIVCNASMNTVFSERKRTPSPANRVSPVSPRSPKLLEEFTAFTPKQ